MRPMVWTRAEIAAAVALVATMDPSEWEQAEARAVIEKAKAIVASGGYVRVVRH